jgi:UDPglucose--hexose-1-phosphate uridylyltransferase
MSDKKEDLPEFRKDLVSGDWILVAAGRKKRPHRLKRLKSLPKLTTTAKGCPFEDPQKSGNPPPLLWYPHPKTPASKIEDLKSWFLQVIPNKYPLLYKDDVCPKPKKRGAEEKLAAVGYHEVIITRDHFRTIDKMSLDEAQIVLKSFKERYRTLSKDPCVKYILIFHNQGETAGASLFHPHSQLVALPIVDPDVASSINGSWNYYKVYKKCVHCVMLQKEERDKVRVINKNKYFITVVPFAPRVSYETRIYPIKHSSRFEDVDKDEIPYLAESLIDALKRVNKVLDCPDFNFFIHTAPTGNGDEHYHWHIEILPRGFKWAGLELGMGIEVVAVPPEIAADDLRKAVKTRK